MQITIIAHYFTLGTFHLYRFQHHLRFQEPCIRLFALNQINDTYPLDFHTQFIPSTLEVIADKQNAGHQMSVLPLEFGDPADDHAGVVVGDGAVGKVSTTRRSS
jgi:hypothetical protein